jgi:transcriptional regulator with XRE-family HTH domain
MKSKPRPVRKRKPQQPRTKSYLRRVRERLGLTQVQFAELIGVAPNSVARWEQGRLGMRPSTARLIELVTQQADAKEKK